MAKKQQADEAPQEASPPPPLRGGRDRWQVPTLLVALALLGFGVYSAITSAPGPDFQGVLDESKALMERDETSRALSLLNGPIRENIDHPDSNPTVRARFHALRGDALYLLAKKQERDVRNDHLAILAEYDRARVHDESVMDRTRTVREISTLIALGRADQAEEMIATLPDSRSPERYELLRELTDVSLSQGGEENVDRALRHLGTLKGEPGVSEELELWAVGRQAEVRIANGNAEAAARELLPAIQRMRDRTTGRAGELLMRLGEAHVELGELVEARKRLDMALSALPDGSIEAGRVEVMLAQIDMMEGKIEAARDRFALATERYRLSPVLVEAALGLGEAEAELGHFEESVASYRELIELLRDPDAMLLEGRNIDDQRREVERSLEQRYRDRFLNEDLEFALEYASLSERLFPPEDLPDDALRRLADTHRRIAVGILREASGTEELVDLDDVEPATAEEARVHFYLAGEYYHRHTKATITRDAQGAADSLWLAADSYDRAGDLQLAIRFFGEYAASRTGDPRQLEARYRLAQAHQALGSYENAIAIYEQIIEENPTSVEAYRSHVPLARSYMMVSEKGRIDKAVDHLRSVLDGTYFEPESPQFRDALIELGQVYHTAGRYPEAIERLREARERYPESEKSDELAFDLADALRLSASEIKDELNMAMPQSRRIELEALREDRLNEALELYESVRASIDETPSARRTPLDEVLLRNAMFYRGDCAFELGEYERAIEHYDAAAQRYADDPVSLVAMVQIVNSHAALDQWRQARTAHARAKARLNEIPEDVWEREDLPMQRDHWERWLDASIRLDESQVASVTDGE